MTWLAIPRAQYVSLPGLSCGSSGSCGSRIPVSSLFSTTGSGANPTLSANLQHQQKKAFAAHNAPIGPLSKNLTDATIAWADSHPQSVGAAVRGSGPTCAIRAHMLRPPIGRSPRLRNSSVGIGARNIGSDIATTREYSGELTSG